jgi:hypothetical protein
MVIPPFSTVPLLPLPGFEVTNLSSVRQCVQYGLFTLGPAALQDNGDPASLSGVTAPLAPHRTAAIPDAVLNVPDIRWYTEQTVDYAALLAGAPAVRDSCVTRVVFEPPVAVVVDVFRARPVDDGVELTWELTADEDIRKIRLLRMEAGDANYTDITGGRPLAKDLSRYVDRDVRRGRTYRYVLTVVQADGTEVRSRAATVDTPVLPLALHQNRPNPFNPTTTIPFSLPIAANVKLSIYDVEGKLVKTLADGLFDEGRAEVVWDGTNARGEPAGSGVYWYRLAAGDKVFTKKMVLLK